MYYAVNKISIGYTRPQGFVLYCSNSWEFLEFSTTEVLRMLKADGPGICGLKLIDGKIELDEQGFHRQNLTVKSSMSMGKYRLMKPNGRIEGRRLHTILQVFPIRYFLLFFVTHHCNTYTIKKKNAPFRYCIFLSIMVK